VHFLIKIRSFFDIPIILSAWQCKTGFIRHREYSRRDRKRKKETKREKEKKEDRERRGGGRQRERERDETVNETDEEGE